MDIPNILIVDDEEDIRALLEITLSRMQLNTYSVENLNKAYELLKTEKIDLCLTDMRLPDGDGLDLVAYIQKYHAHIPVAVITAYGCIETAIKALKAGAFDFLTKPLEIKNLRNIVLNALKTEINHHQLAENPKLRLIGRSKTIEDLRLDIQKLSKSHAPIFICGESGTGKELVARLLHHSGPRAEAPFIAVNCGAIPSELMESEFFGHKKGSFTGATQDKKGLFQAADGGTLFLDEVADLPLHMQVKLLRAIQEKAIRPIGSYQEISVDVRILSASHKNLRLLADEGKFREDLYYRINVIELQVPSLRDRVEDIPLLADFILEKIIKNQSFNKKPQLSHTAIKALQNYPFPGNVRELENILERALTLSDDGYIEPKDLQLPKLEEPITITHKVSNQVKNISSQTSQLSNPPAALADIEKNIILKALEEARWNKTKAAEILNITPRQLRYRLKKMGID